MKKPVFDRDRSRLSINLSPLFVVFVLVMSAVFGRVLYLQTVLGSELTKQSEANRIRHETIPAQRGMILDRDGEILAADEPVFHLQTRRGLRSMNTRQVRSLAEGLNLKFERLRERLKSRQRHFLLRGMTDAQRIWFEENSHRFPGLEVKIRPKRVYQHGSVIAPVVGYTGEISPAMLSRRRDEGLSQGSIVGKAGVERVYDHYLQGRKGIRWIEVSAKGERIRTLQSPPPTPPRHGRSLQLNIDLDLQQFVAHSFPADSAGAAVVMKIPSGRIRALYSHPTYNPNALTIAGSRRINRLLEAEDDPLHNRAIQSRFPPGSTFKILPFLAAHVDDNFQTNREFNCDGEFQLGTGTFGCWKESGHGTLNLIEGLVNSCNVYFYKLVRELGWNEVIDMARQFHFGRPSGVDLPDEADPQLSTPSLKESRYGRPWVGGDALNAVIGQGYTLISPIKQAQLLGEIVMGRRVKPSVAQRAVPEQPLPELDVSPTSRKALLETMDAVTDRGTGYWAQHDTSYRTIEPDILGKTGTIQKVKTDDESDTPPADAWFISAAPADDPRYVVVVFRIEAGTGGSVAAPHARRIYQSMNRLGYFSDTRNRRAAGFTKGNRQSGRDTRVGRGEG